MLARNARAAAAIAAFVSLMATVGWLVTRKDSPPAVASSTYAGSAACAACHASEWSAWRSSHHASAERDAVGARSVLPSDHVTLDTAQGDQDFAVTGTVGVAPLIQPLVVYQGRTQVASRGWDVARKEWFSVFDDARKPSEWGHFTGRGMTYATQCAFCHGTGFEKRYVVDADRFDSQWAERAVGCEACHGPRRAHVVASAGKTPNAPTAPAPIAPDSARLGPSDEPFTCAPCHARRGELASGFVPGTSSYYDYFEPILPSDPAFYADGQVKEEDFEWASFRQSAMSEHGVRCTHCHEPHAGTLRLQGNALCLQCHDDALSAKSHTFHERGPGTECVGCHMPATSYMQRHARRDHSFTKPLPALTSALGIPNACNRCHADRSAGWANTWFERWYGRRERAAESLARTFERGRARDPEARSDLADLLARKDAPEVLRAAAAALLEDLPPGADAARALESAAHDPSALVRSKAVHARIAWGDARGTDAALEDPVRLVRLAAGARKDAVAQAEHDADRPEGRLRLAMLAASPEEAEKHLRAALSLDALNPEVHYELARVLAVRGQRDEARRSLETVLKLDPTFPDAQRDLDALP